MEDPNFYFDFNVKYFNYIRQNEESILRTIGERTQTKTMPVATGSAYFGSSATIKPLNSLGNKDFKIQKREFGLMFKSISNNCFAPKFR